MSTKIKGPAATPAQRRSYGIAFDTKSKPGKLMAVVVSVEVKEIAPDEVVNVSLKDDEHYATLVHYVMNNMAQQGKAS